MPRDNPSNGADLGHMRPIEVVVQERRCPQRALFLPIAVPAALRRRANVTGWGLQGKQRHQRFQEPVLVVFDRPEIRAARRDHLMT